MTENELMLLLGVFVIIVCFIAYALWQGFKMNDPNSYFINVNEIAPFKEQAANAYAWYVVRQRQWPPIKIGEVTLLSKWPFIKIERVRDQIGLLAVYKDNRDLVGEIKLYNAFESYIEYKQGEIHSLPYAKDGPNYIKNISYNEQPSGREILKLPVMFDLGQTLEFPFLLNNENYIFEIGLSNLRVHGRLYKEGKLEAIFARVTAKQIMAALALTEPNNAALLICVDIFCRRVP